MSSVHVSTVRFYAEQILERPIADRTWARWCRFVLAPYQRVCTEREAQLLCTIASAKHANPKCQFRGGRAEIEALLKAQIDARQPRARSARNVQTWDDLAQYLGVHRATCFRWRKRYRLDFPETPQDFQQWELLSQAKAVAA